MLPYVTTAKSWLLQLVGAQEHFIAFLCFTTPYLGRTVKPKRHLLGNNGLVQFGPNADLVKGFNDWLQIGFPHHVCVVEGHRGSRIEAFCKQQGVKIT